MTGGTTSRIVSGVRKDTLADPKLTMSTNAPEKAAIGVWLLRILALVIVIAAFIVAGSVEDDTTPLYLRAAVTVVYLYSFVGAASLLRGTFRKDFQQVRFFKQFLDVVWLLLVAAVAILVRLYAF